MAHTVEQLKIEYAGNDPAGCWHVSGLFDGVSESAFDNTAAQAMRWLFQIAASYGRWSDSPEAKMEVVVEEKREKSEDEVLAESDAWEESWVDVMDTSEPDTRY